MDLILWRHAEAEIGAPDDDRVLTPKGVKQASKMAAWLEQNLPDGCRILVSPATRTVQTAQALHRKFKLHANLAQHATALELLEAANWPSHRDPVVLVGHQPALGRLAALLISGVEQDWTIRKGNIWWISQRDRNEVETVFLRAVMTTDLMTK